MRKITRFFYVYMVKPILFLFPADAVHEFFLKTGNILGRYNFIKKILTKIWSYSDPILEQNILGLNFKNPIGLSAGFDYDADLVEILPSIGFGFHTIGTVTHEPYSGNAAPMLGRLPKSKSLLVNKGFKNKGIKNVLPNLQNNNSGAPRGVSIGATNKQYSDFDAMVKDLQNGFKDAENFQNFDFYELNISCPNLLNTQNLTEHMDSPKGLVKTLKAISTLDLQRPVFIKMPLEKTKDETTELLAVASEFPFISGLIFSNLDKDRTNKSFNEQEILRSSRGNFSGKPVEEKSNELLSHAYKNYKNRFILIGVGGVFTAEDAYKKIRLGSNLVQMITGMIYMGPSQIGIINQELENMLKKDGYTSIKDAVGTLTYD